MRSDLERVLSARAETTTSIAQGADGRARRLRLVPTLDADGAVEHVHCIVEDATDLARAEARILALEAELREAREAAEAEKRHEQAFVAETAAELRTPMNAIVGYAQILRRDVRLDARQRHCVDVIARSGDHLVELVTDVVEIAKIEAGLRRTTSTIVDLDALFEEIDRAARPRAEGRRLSFTVQRGAEVPRYVVTDEPKVREILDNLIGRATRLTRRGGITVRALTPSSLSPRLVLEVEDTGTGIAPEEIEPLFQPSMRPGAPANGNGLGLPLSRRLARLMTGDITVRSTIGRGTVFRVDLPLEVGPPPLVVRDASARVARSTEAGPPIRVLVVDAHRESRTWVTTLLSSVGFHARDVGDGVSSLTMFDAWRPDVIVAEIDPTAPGTLAAIRSIRARPGGRSVAVIAVSESAFDDARHAVFESGADAWLRKPLHERALLDEIGRLVGPSECSTTAAECRTETLRSHEADRPLTAEEVAALREAARDSDRTRLAAILDALPPQSWRAAADLRQLLARSAYGEIECFVDRRG